MSTRAHATLPGHRAARRHDRAILGQTPLRSLFLQAWAPVQQRGSTRLALEQPRLRRILLSGLSARQECQVVRRRRLASHHLACRDRQHRVRSLVLVLQGRSQLPWEVLRPHTTLLLWNSSPSRLVRRLHTCRNTAGLG